MKFCQIDGTPLVPDAPAIDPYKTIVSRSVEIPAITPDPPPSAPASEPPASPADRSINEPEDLLDVPSAADPLKTMYVSDEEMRAAMGAVNVPDPVPPAAAAPPEPQPPDFLASELNVRQSSEPPPPSEPPAPTSPAAAFDATNPPIPSPFDAAPIEPEKELPAAEPVPELPPAYEPKEDETVIQPPASPFSDARPEFAPEPPPTPAFEPPPFAEPEPVQPVVTPQFEPAAPVAEWTPPPAPDPAWQDQQIGQDTPFQSPPPGTSGQSKGLAIGSLVCGVLSCLCCISVITGPIGIVLGFIARKKAKEEPQAFGGEGLALGGMITGAVGFLIGVGLIILQLSFGLLSNLAR